MSTTTYSGTGLTNTRASSTFNGRYDGLPLPATATASLDISTVSPDATPTLSPAPPAGWSIYQFDMNNILARGTYYGYDDLELEISGTEPVEFWLTYTPTDFASAFLVSTTTSGSYLNSYNFPSGLSYYAVFAPQNELLFSLGKPNTEEYNYGMGDLSGYFAVLPEPILITPVLAGMLLLYSRRRK
jgi:hypothetical protein